MSIEKKINKIANSLGIEGEKTILKLKDEDKNRKVLELESGSFDSKKPWFIVDENNKVHPLISMELLLTLLNTTKSVLQENLNIRLEKAIMQELPIDYNDVLAVAMNEVSSVINSPKDKNLLNLNVDRVVKKIKKKYPNLFYNIDINEMISKGDL